MNFKLGGKFGGVVWNNIYELGDLGTTYKKVMGFFWAK